MPKPAPIGGMSPNEVKLLGYLRHYIGANVKAPTYDEIMRACSFGSRSRVSGTLDALEEAGHIIRVRDKRQCVVITSAGMSVKLPEQAF